MKMQFLLWHSHKLYFPLHYNKNPFVSYQMQWLLPGHLLSMTLSSYFDFFVPVVWVKIPDAPRKQESKRQNYFLIDHYWHRIFLLDFPLNTVPWYWSCIDANIYRYTDRHSQIFGHIAYSDFWEYTDWQTSMNRQSMPLLGYPKIHLILYHLEASLSNPSLPLLIHSARFDLYLNQLPVYWNNCTILHIQHIFQKSNQTYLLPVLV